MNKDNAKEFLPLVQALAEGKTIQAKDVSGDWADRIDLYLGNEPDCYRIKPEAITLDVWYHDLGYISQYSMAEYDGWRKAKATIERWESGEGRGCTALTVAQTRICQCGRRCGTKKSWIANRAVCKVVKENKSTNK